jgi:tetratricopeptide (TPR) repeat protein
MEQYDRAVLDYEKAIQINKKQIEPYINIINSLRASNQIDKAISFFEKSQKNNIEHAFLWALL